MTSYSFHKISFDSSHRNKPYIHHEFGRRDSMGDFLIFRYDGIFDPTEIELQNDADPRTMHFYKTGATGIKKLAETRYKLPGAGIIIVKEIILIHIVYFTTYPKIRLPLIGFDDVFTIVTNGKEIHYPPSNTYINWRVQQQRIAVFEHQYIDRKYIEFVDRLNIAQEIWRILRNSQGTGGYARTNLTVSPSTFGILLSILGGTVKRLPISIRNELIIQSNAMQNETIHKVISFLVKIYKCQSLHEPVNNLVSQNFYQMSTSIEFDNV